MAVVAVGVVTLHFDGGNVLVLQDCLYVPNVRRNLILVSCLACDEFSDIFNKKFISIKYDVDVICREMLVGNQYMLKPITPLQINSYESNHKRKDPFSVNQAQFWHLKLGHINLDRIRRLVTSGHISPLDLTSLLVCEP